MMALQRCSIRLQRVGGVEQSSRFHGSKEFAGCERRAPTILAHSPNDGDGEPFVKRHGVGDERIR